MHDFDDIIQTGDTIFDLATVINQTGCPDNNGYQVPEIESEEVRFTHIIETIESLRFEKLDQPDSQYFRYKKSTSQIHY